MDELLESDEPDYSWATDPDTMTLERAEATVLYIGRYKGQTISQIARDKEGLKWLDWLIGEDWFKSFQQFKALKFYLDDPFVSKEVDELLLGDG